MKIDRLFLKRVMEINDRLCKAYFIVDGLIDFQHELTTEWVTTATITLLDIDCVCGGKVKIFSSTEKPEICIENEFMHIQAKKALGLINKYDQSFWPDIREKNED